MILHYDRIRDEIKRRWEEEDRVPSLETGVVDVRQDLFDYRDSHVVKDQKIPLWYKKAIAKRLFHDEPEAVKAEVRAHREAWHCGLGKTVRTDDEDERLQLVREYNKYVRIRLYHHPQSHVFSPRNVPALNRSIATVLRNAEQKCSAKGITWLACPAPSKGGKPSGHL